MSFNPLTAPPITYALPQHLSHASAWVQHIPFAFTITALAKPFTFVELGTFMGDSYFAFCQAIKTLGLPTRCTAIDTWKGDPQTGQYDDHILRAVQGVNKQYSDFSTLLQTDFDSALASFPDHSIDLLHIDGLHTYEAVKHDFETWLPKLSSRGIVLFHDTAVTDPGYGVGKFFDELSIRCPCFQFRHGFGLGIAAPGRDTSPVILDFIREANTHPEAMRLFYSSLGDRVEWVRQAIANVGCALQTQSLVNQARTKFNLPVDPRSERFDIAMQSTLNYFRFQQHSITELLARINPPVPS